MKRPLEYWQAVALEIEAQNRKAEIYVSDNHALGIARETILRRLMATETPEPYRVRTGFVFGHDANGTARYSKQCDVLVYNPALGPPEFQIDEFVVVSNPVARLVVEVKSDLDAAGFSDTVAVWRSTMPFSVPALGFAHEGVTFDNFIPYLSGAIANDIGGLPPCIVVHEQNYVGVRPTHWSAERTVPLPQYYLAVNLGTVPELKGVATGIFLSQYASMLASSYSDALSVYTWFNNLRIPDECKVRVAPDGQVSRGQIEM